MEKIMKETLFHIAYPLSVLALLLLLFCIKGLKMHWDNSSKAGRIFLTTLITVFAVASLVTVLTMI